MRTRRILTILGIVLGGLLAAAFSAAPVSARPLEQAGRPNLPNPQNYGTEHFLVHYTFTGRQAINAADADGSGVPDYVERVAETLEYVWQVEIDVMGWPTPPGDRGEGGDTRLDVYLDEVLADGYAGYVDTEGGYLGDNPATPQQERRAAYAYLVLDDDYVEVDASLGETPLELMQATVAHEFNHVLQAGIDDRDLHVWLYEASASWMEDEVYDDVNDVRQYLDSVYKNPDICLVAEVARGDDLHWYGTWLLLRLMSERYGPDVVRTIWENMRQFNGFGSIDATLVAYGSSLVAETRDFAVANLLRAYEEGETYPTVRVEAEIGPGTYTPADGVQSLGADYVRLLGSGPLVVSLLAADGPLSVRAVGLRGAEADVIEMAGNVLHLNRDDYDDVYLIIHNDAQIGLESDCTFAGYTLDVAPSSALPTPVASNWPAGFFLSPFDEPVSVVSGGAGTYSPPDEPFGGTEDYAATPEELNVSFQTLLPASLPSGYTFDYAYIMTEADFGENAIYYVPGGGDTANFDYLDPEGNWLSIAESVSPYLTVQEWIDAIQYYDTPGEIRSVDGVDVLIEDLSDSSEVWYSATLIIEGLFIVVDGDHTEQAVIQLVQGLIQSAQAGEGGVLPQPGVSPQPPAVQTQPPPLVTAAPFATATPPGPWGADQWMASLSIGLCLTAFCVAVLLVVIIVVVVLRRRR